ncbi:DUF7345 domain-containing protein [Haladaptatus sp. GCM10025893]|uniref:DUF7345 domain-containing protein n=1 Tax=Haladaptatus sp. GCM10025893 TaxID=3252659 RepID=UPI00362083DE
MKGLSAACLAFLLVFAATAPAVAAPPDNPEGSSGSIAAAQEFDRTEFIVEIYENGSARWTFSYRWTLETDEDRQQFNQYATEFNENETELYKQFQNQSQALATSGEQATGRTMSASDFSKQAYVSELGNEGIVEMQFTWSNFAQTGDDQVVVGDVFEGGLYIGPNQSFVIKHDGPLQFAEAEPEPGAVSGGSLATSDSLTWFEDTQFADQQPRVVLAPPGSDQARPRPMTASCPNRAETSRSSRPPSCSSCSLSPPARSPTVRARSQPAVAVEAAEQVQVPLRSRPAAVRPHPPPPRPPSRTTNC